MSFNLEWACRRGMLELDKMIMPFYKQNYPHLTPEQQATFRELLNYTDPELFAWLMRKHPAPTPALQEIVFLIRNALSEQING